MVRTLPNQMIDPICGCEPLGRKILFRRPEIEQYRFAVESFAAAFEVDDFLERSLDERMWIARPRLKYLRLNVHM